MDSIILESVIVQDWLDRGRAEGMAKGSVETKRLSVREVLDARFGEMPFLVRERLMSVRSLDVLKELNRAAAQAATLDDFAKHLPIGARRKILPVCLKATAFHGYPANGRWGWIVSIGRSQAGLLCYEMGKVEALKG